MIQKSTRYFLSALLVTACFALSASTETKDDTSFYANIKSGLESAVNKVFNKEFIQTVKAETNKILKHENVQKVKGWFEKDPGAKIFGISLPIICIFRKWRIPFYLSLGGVIGGLGWSMYHQEYKDFAPLFQKNTNHYPAE